jgi:hypothetical protein
VNKPEWTYCRNCVAWRKLLAYQREQITFKDDIRLCRLKCDNVDNFRHGDDGCCEGVPKVGKAGGAK